MHLGEKLKNARTEKKLLQKDIAKFLTDFGRPTSSATISNWELNISEPDIDTLALLCQILEKDGNYFFELENNQDIQFAQYGGLDIADFTEEDMEELKMQIEIIKKRKEKRK